MTDTILQNIVDDLNGCSDITIKYDADQLEWTAEFEYDRCGFSGRGNTPEEALIEAAVDRGIADFYYYGSVDGPEFTQDEMNMRLRDTYRRYLGRHPDHEYRGDYLKKATEPQNPRQAANQLILTRLENAIDLYPDMRFWQILMNLDVLDYRMVDGQFYCRDPWNEESAMTLKRMKETI